MAEKLKMMSKDIIQENIDYISEKFPNVLKEVKDEKGNIVKKIDFDVLKQELSNEVIDDKQERYQMTWPDKKKAILLANSKINATLRPCKEKSVDFENTKNLYIEGDNLDVLKLLRETYLGKIKMIYIDPPYNTGNDFVYEDDFSQSSEDYFKNSGQYDEQGNRLVSNNESNGRFHTDWLNMIYPRLKVSKDLLSNEGVIAISIDENEVHNLTKICNEIFGESNFVTQITWHKKTQPSFLSKKVSDVTEFILIYQKREFDLVTLGGFTDVDKLIELINISNEPCDRILKKESVLINSGKYNGVLKSGYFGNGDLKIYLKNDVQIENGIPRDDLFLNGRFKWSQKLIDESSKKGDTIHIKNINSMRPTVERIDKTPGIKPILNLLSKKINDDIPTNTDGNNEIKNLFEGYCVMDYPKPTNLIKYLIRAFTFNDKNSIIMDFFSGSATTAESVFKQNIEDQGNRKFIMVQIPENIPEDSPSFDMGIKTICELGQERIKRCTEKLYKFNNLDNGFRVLKLDSSNMNDVFYNTKNTQQSLINDLVDNIKPDRNELDLLFQVMLELGIDLSSKIEEKTIGGKKCFLVNENDIVACFENNLDENSLKEIAKTQPVYFVFKDSSFSSDASNINCEQIIKSICPNMPIENIKVI